MTNLDAFSITSSEDMDLICPVEGCYVSYVSISNGDNLAEIRKKAERHLAEGHAIVIEGEAVAQRPAIAQ